MTRQSASPQAGAREKVIVVRITLDHGGNLTWFNALREFLERLGDLREFGICQPVNLAETRIVQDTDVFAQNNLRGCLERPHRANRTVIRRLMAR